MREWHETLLAAMHEERRRLTSRRGLLAGGGKLAAGGAAALALGAVPGAGAAFAQQGSPAASPVASPGATAGDFEDDLDVLNYALTLELLENAFYRDGVGLFDFGTDGFGNSINEFLATIGAHEAEHVATLTQVITDLGGTPVTEQAYDFGEAYASLDAFLETAQALENTGVSAYDGAGAALSDPDLLTAAGTIVAVEALHASYLNVLNGDLPAPEPFETPLSRGEVLEIAGEFIVGDAATPVASN